MVIPNQPLLSVVIPCLNRAHFLVPTIASVLQQNYPHIECIVVDGGSTDGTIEILNRYGDRIKWISEPDNGQAHAINKGFRMSAGEILAWLNADDVWAVPNAASQAVAYLQANPEVDVVYGDCGAIDTEGNPIGMSYLREWDLEYAVEYCDHCIPQPSAFIRRRALERVGWLDTNFILADQDLWYRIGLTGTMSYEPSLWSYARVHPSYWHSKSHIVAANCVQMVRKFFDNPDLSPNFHRMKRRAISNAYLRGMYYACFERHWKTIFTYALRAALVDLTNARNAFRSLRRYVADGAAEDRWLKWVLIGLESPTLPVRAFRRVKRSIFGLALPVAEPVEEPGEESIEEAGEEPVEEKELIPNIVGDRAVEWSWVISQMPPGPGEALDLGPEGSHLSLVAAQRGFNVIALDLQPVHRLYRHPRLQFVQGDILKPSLPKEHFDLIINCSTVEHVGLAGRYGVAESRPDGDLEAMVRLRELMKPGGAMLLTIPVGQDEVFAPFCRVYGTRRLPRLLEGYTVEEEAFWVKDSQNRWVLSDREIALNFKASAGSDDPLQCIYALGCFVLREAEH